MRIFGRVLVVYKMRMFEEGSVNTPRRSRIGDPTYGGTNNTDSADIRTGGPHLPRGPDDTSRPFLICDVASSERVGPLEELLNKDIAKGFATQAEADATAPLGARLFLNFFLQSSKTFCQCAKTKKKAGGKYLLRAPRRSASRARRTRPSLRAPLYTARSSCCL